MNLGRFQAYESRSSTAGVWMDYPCQEHRKGTVRCVLVGDQLAEHVEQFIDAYPENASMIHWYKCIGTSVGVEANALRK